MVTVALFAIIGAASVMAQQSHAISGFNYKGCSNIDITCFGEPVILPDNCITPEACQTACQGFQFAALLNEACRCGNDATAIHATDEGQCDHCCMNDSQLGECGNSCPSDNPGIANIYEKAANLQSYSSALPQTAVAPTSTPCLSETSSVGSLVSFTSVPDYPQSVTMDTVLSEPPCPVETTSASPPSGYHTPEGQAPEPQTYVTSAASAASPTDGCTNTALCYQNTPGSVLTPIYETTFWPVTSNKAYGEAPLPSQVPWSDSAPFQVPSFSTIGGLALIAAMII